eukprot:tig00020556_g11044.t1
MTNRSAWRRRHSRLSAFRRQHFEHLRNHSTLPWPRGFESSGELDRGAVAGVSVACSMVALIAVLFDSSSRR